MGLSYQDVFEALKMDFKSDELKRAKEILDQYGGGPNEPEPVRVMMAIIKLSVKDMGALQKNVDAAKQDYKSVLLWAE